MGCFLVYLFIIVKSINLFSNINYFYQLFPKGKCLKDALKKIIVFSPFFSTKLFLIVYHYFLKSLSFKFLCITRYIHLIQKCKSKELFRIWYIALYNIFKKKNVKKNNYNYLFQYFIRIRRNIFQHNNPINRHIPKHVM